MEALDAQGRTLLCHLLQLRSQEKSTRRRLTLCIFLLNRRAEPPPVGATVVEGNEACLRCMHEHGARLALAVMLRSPMGVPMGLSEVLPVIENFLPQARSL